jgi:hypothetical protein
LKVIIIKTNRKPKNLMEAFMELHIEWDGKHYPRLCSDDICISNDAKELLSILDKLEGKPKRFEITKENLELLKKLNIKYWNSQTIYDKDGNVVKNKYFDSMEKKIFDYLLGKTDDLSFLKDINN